MNIQEDLKKVKLNSYMVYFVFKQTFIYIIIHIIKDDMAECN